MPTDTAGRILAALRERYPCAEVPRGAWKKIGQEFGVSGERVRQIATNAGWTRRNGLTLRPLPATVARPSARREAPATTAGGFHWTAPGAVRLPGKDVQYD